MSHIASQHPAPEHFILHVSDTHFVGDGDLLHERIDSDKNLAELFDGFFNLRSPQSALSITSLSRRPLNEAQHALWSGAWFAAT